jgi:branched-chain amino acid transport system permease protein
MIDLLRKQWNLLLEKRWLVPALLATGFGLAFVIPEYHLLSVYVQLILM